MDIHSYHNVEALSAILNAIAAISGANDYRAALSMAAFFGFMAAGLAYALAPQKLQGWQWLASVTLVLSVLFVPKMTVRIVDVSLGQAPRVVDNVPFGLAVLAGSTTAVGNVITDLFEQAMQVLPGDGQMPADLSYRRNGMVFGSRLVSVALSQGFVDSSMRIDMANYFANCIEPDIVSRRISADTMMNSTNLWADVMSEPNPARFSTVVVDGVQDLRTCTAVLESLNARMVLQQNKMLDAIAMRVHPELILTAARSRVADEMNASFAKQRIISAGLDMSNTLAQSAIIGAIGEGAVVAGGNIGDSTKIVMASAQASALRSTNMAFINNAKLAEQALPVVRNVIEAMTYALFPLMILLMMLSSGKDTLAAFKNYASVLIWIQLWPPMYAILNYMVFIYANQDMAAAASRPDVSGLNLATYGAISDSALTSQAVVGYLLWSVPALSWMALKRMENFGSGLAGSLNTLGSSGTSESASAAKGNFSQGAMSFNQVRGMQDVTDPANRRVQGVDGTTTTNYGNGLVTEHRDTNTGAHSRVLTGTVKQVEQHKAAIQTTRASVKAITESRNAASSFSDVQQLLGSRAHSKTGQTSETSNVVREAGESAATIQSTTDRYSKGSSVDDMQSTTGNVHLALSLKAAGNGVGAEAMKGWGTAKREQFSKLLDSVSSEDAQKFQRASQTLARATSQMAANTELDSDTRTRAASYAKAYSASTSATEQLSEAASVERSAANMAETGLTTSFNMSAEDLALFRALHDRDTDIAARGGEGLAAGVDAQTRMKEGSDLALRSLGPAQVWDGKKHNSGNAADLEAQFGKGPGAPPPMPTDSAARVAAQNKNDVGAVNLAKAKRNAAKPATNVPPGAPPPPPPNSAPMGTPASPGLSFSGQAQGSTIWQAGDALRRQIDNKLERNAAGNLFPNPAVGLQENLLGQAIVPALNGIGNAGASLVLNSEGPVGDYARGLSKRADQLQLENPNRGRVEALAIATGELASRSIDLENGIPEAQRGLKKLLGEQAPGSGQSQPKSVPYSETLKNDPVLNAAGGFVKSIVSEGAEVQEVAKGLREADRNLGEIEAIQKAQDVIAERGAGAGQAKAGGKAAAQNPVPKK